MADTENEHSQELPTSEQGSGLQPERAKRARMTSVQQEWRRRQLSPYYNKRYGIIDASEKNIDHLRKLSAPENEAYVRENLHRCIKTLSVGIASSEELSGLTGQSTDFEKVVKLFGKYRKKIRLAYVGGAVVINCKNLYSAHPEKPKFDETDVRLATMEELRDSKYKNKITGQQYDYLHQEYFADIRERKIGAGSAAINMLRCQAVGKMSRPTDQEGLDRAKKKLEKLKTYPGKFAPEAYDLTGTDEKGEPLYPAWYAVKDSRNFQHNLLKVQSIMAEKGIRPKDAYRFNQLDFACLFEKKDSFEISAKPPFNEFCERLGGMIAMGKEGMPEATIYDSWEARFATHEELALDGNGKKAVLEKFGAECRDLCQKIHADFKQAGISDKYFDSWVANMTENGLHNPESVSKAEPHEKIPYKIEIHHKRRLSDGGPLLNNLDNFCLMVMFDSDGRDVHQSKHKESPHFIWEADEEEVRKDEQSKAIYESSTQSAICSERFSKGDDSIIWHGLKERGLNARGRLESSQTEIPPKEVAKNSPRRTSFIPPKKRGGSLGE